MKSRWTPTLVCAAAAFLFATFWMSTEPGEIELHRVLVAAITFSGGTSAFFVWPHLWVRSRDRAFAARGIFRGLVTGIVTVLMAWITFSVTMYFLIGRQLSLPNLLYQYGQKIVWSIQRGTTPVALAVVYGITGYFLARFLKEE